VLKKLGVEDDVEEISMDDDDIITLRYKRTLDLIYGQDGKDVPSFAKGTQACSCNMIRVNLAGKRVTGEPDQDDTTTVNRKLDVLIVSLDSQKETWPAYREKMRQLLADKLQPLLDKGEIVVEIRPEHMDEDLLDSAQDRCPADPADPAVGGRGPTEHAPVREGLPHRQLHVQAPGSSVPEYKQLRLLTSRCGCRRFSTCMQTLAGRSTACTGSERQPKPSHV